MMRWKYFPSLIITLIFLSACGTSAASYNNQGNKAFLAERYDEAMERYTSAKQEDATIPEPYYNSGNTLHRQGDMDAASLELQEALRANDNGLAQKSFYNLGNTYFKQEDWTGAIEAYRRALLLNPEDEQAKYNLELALEQLLQEQSQQPPPQQQPNQGDQQQPNEGGGQQNQDQQQPQPGEDEEQDGGGEGDQNDQSGSGEQPQQPQPERRELSQEEAKQLLDALGQDSQTLQERLQQQFGSPELPPEQDW